MDTSEEGPTNNKEDFWKVDLICPLLLMEELFACQAENFLVPIMQSSFVHSLYDNQANLDCRDHRPSMSVEPHTLSIAGLHLPQPQQTCQIFSFSSSSSFSPPLLELPPITDSILTIEDITMEEYSSPFFPFHDHVSCCFKDHTLKAACSNVNWQFPQGNNPFFFHNNLAIE
jgi:hypothetical protein